MANIFSKAKNLFKSVKYGELKTKSLDYARYIALKIWYALTFQETDSNIKKVNKNWVVYSYLKAKYKQFLLNYKRIENKTHEYSDIIWWCWLQGIEVAPPIVRACYNSLVQGEWFKVNGYKVNVIDAENWKDYIELPDYIVKKWEKEQIPSAMFSDLLRLQLLIKYGGTWIDSTVLCTLDSSFKFQCSSSQKYLDADLFLFQYTPEGTMKDISISNWFISAHSNNEVLMTLRDMLFAYWKDYNCTLDYYMFHLFFQMVAKDYPEQIEAMPYGNSMNSLVLLHHWDETFDQKKWDKLISRVSFHKLAFRVGMKTKVNKNNFYNYIVNTNKEIENGRI